MLARYVAIEMYQTFPVHLKKSTKDRLWTIVFFHKARNLSKVTRKASALIKTLQISR